MACSGQLCAKSDIQTGDLIEIAEYHGRVTVVKKQVGAGTGVLKRLKHDASRSDEQSLQNAWESQHPKTRKRRRA